MGLISQLLANKANAEQSRLANSRNIQMWNMQNEYNLPQNQMERFRQAGLNPNLMYQQGNAGNATSIAPYQPAHMSYDFRVQNILEALGKYQDLKIKQAQTSNITADTQIKLAEALYRPEYLLGRNQLIDWNVASAMLKGQLDQAQYRELFKTGMGHMLNLKPEYEALMRQKLASELGLPSLQYESTQQSVVGQQLENALRKIDLKWREAEKWIGSGARAIGTFFNPLRIK